ncbi:hypothetical protein BDF20DRAFT_930117 [Mycotypha africana]|uniref:uncharacterized protein n=1 Tax=Mycotypha africana TaxID=64632 RepID=UPI002301C4AE|nr:uncharacterized protein BDF20DRAFT_930117 [Mycotypha africana]KAI8987533.1 hypothetical protein BDF20DRAFT_930117 [Mycotypha africana]
MQCVCRDFSEKSETCSGRGKLEKNKMHGNKRKRDLDRKMLANKHNGSLSFLAYGRPTVKACGQIKPMVKQCGLMEGVSLGISDLHVALLKKGEKSLIALIFGFIFLIGKVHCGRGGAKKMHKVCHKALEGGGGALSPEIPVTKNGNKKWSK